MFRFTDSVFFRPRSLLLTGFSRKARVDSLRELDACIESLRPRIFSPQENSVKLTRKTVKIHPEQKESLPTVNPLDRPLPFLWDQSIPVPPMPTCPKKNDEERKETEELNLSLPNVVIPPPQISSDTTPFSPPPPPSLFGKKLVVPILLKEDHPLKTTEPKQHPLRANGILPLISNENSEVVFFCLGGKVGEAVQRTIDSGASCGVHRELSDVISLVTPFDISKWSWKKSVHTVVLVIDNRGLDTEQNKDVFSLVSHFLRKEITVKIALPRAEYSHEKRSFENLINQKSGSSRCAKSLRGALVIENERELSSLDLPMQTILQKLSEKREMALSGIPSKESIEQRENAAKLIYDKGEPVRTDNVVAVNLWLRGITFVPPNFRAAMLLHPDRSENENKIFVESKDQKTGILTAIQKEASLKDKVIFYDNQYWTVTSDVRWNSKQDTQALLITLRLKNPNKSLLIRLSNNQVYAENKKINSPEQTIFVLDFKLYTRVIPYYNEKGLLTGVERTFLANNAQQPSKEKWRTKLARGVTSGASVSFFGSKAPKYKILGEGSENVLSALEVARKYPEALLPLGIVVKEDQDKCNCQFTAALGVSDLVKVPIQESVHTVLLITDIDGYNMETKQTILDTVDTFIKRGLKVKVIFAPAKTLGKKRDLNDVLREEGVDAARRILLDPVDIFAKEDLGPASEILQLSLLSIKLKTKLSRAPFEKRPELLYSLGEIYFDSGKLDHSLDCFCQALEGATRELRVKIQHMLGSIWLKKDNPERAFDYYTKSLEGKLELNLDPEDLEVLSSLEGIGKSYAEQKAYDLASSYFAKSFEAKVRHWKSDEHVGLGPLFYELGMVDFFQGNWSKALFHFKRALQLKTKEVGSRNHLGVTEILVRIGDIHFRQKQYSEAIQYYKNAVETLHKIFSSDRHGLDSDIFMKIAKAYYHQNLIEDSLEFFRKSLSQGKITSSTVLQQLLRRAQQLELKKQEEKHPEILNINSIQTPPIIPNFASNLSTALKINILRERSLNVRQVVLDLEMTGTGLKTDRITEIGCVVLTNLKRSDEVFQRYVNPGCRVRPEAHRLTGLTHRFLSQFPPFKDIALDFLKFIQDSDLIIHGASNDVHFLSEELEASGIPYNLREKHQIIDTVDIAKLLFPDKRNSLDALNKVLNINQPRPKHAALLDAEITAEVYLSMLSLETLMKIKP